MTLKECKHGNRADNCGNCGIEGLRTKDKKSMTEKKSLIRSLIKNDAFRKLHDKWSSENQKLLESHKNDWNFGIIVRNHTRDAFDKMIELARADGANINATRNRKRSK